MLSTTSFLCSSFLSSSLLSFLSFSKERISRSPLSLELHQPKNNQVERQTACHNIKGGERRAREKKCDNGMGLSNALWRRREREREEREGREKGEKKREGGREEEEEEGSTISGQITEHCIAVPHCIGTWPIPHNACRRHTAHPHRKEARLHDSPCLVAVA